MKDFAQLGHKTVRVVENVGLLIIAISTVIAVIIEIDVMIEAREVRLADLLLLFIYLEVLAMVANYLDYGQLPVRMPLYIAIVALARYVILDMKSMDSWRIMAIAVSILVIVVAVFVHRYGHAKFPYEPPPNQSSDKK